jgi:hypothetical protein
VSRDFAKELPYARVGERLDGVAGGRLALSRDDRRPLRTQLRHPIDERFRGEELGLFPCEHRRLVDAERRPELLGGARELLAKGLDLVGAHVEAPPATVILATRIVGDAVAVRMSRSFPTASMRFQSSSTLSEMVTSLTG